MSGLGLGGYSSSDDEEDMPPVDSTVSDKAVNVETIETTATVATEPSQDLKAPGKTSNGHPTSTEESIETAPSATVGPSLPADVSESTSQTPQLPEADPSLSPYSHTRQQVRLLTMPPVPNFDIPPSPRSADPSDVAVLNKKVRHFLELKQRGVHFNQRLLTSNALGNPAMTTKLLDFAGIEGVLQYDHALPDGLGIDVRQWAGMRIEDIVAQMDQARRRHADGVKGRPREFVSSSGK